LHGKGSSKYAGMMRKRQTSLALNELTLGKIRVCFIILVLGSHHFVHYVMMMGLVWGLVQLQHIKPLSKLN